MGWNTSILFLNDSIDVIKDNPESVVNNICQMMDGVYNLRQRDLCAGDTLQVGDRGNPMTLIHRDHADVTNLVAIGGNYCSTIFRGNNHGYHHDKEKQIELLKAAAESLGYRLSKIP